MGPGLLGGRGETGEHECVMMSVQRNAELVSSSEDSHTGGGVVVFVGTEMGEAEKSRRGGRELEVGERCMQFAVVT